MSKSVNRQNVKNPIHAPKRKSIAYSNYLLPFVLIITAIIFGNTLGNDFASWDDSVTILNNDIIKQLNWESIKEIFFNFRGTDFPLTIFSFALEYKFFGLNPFYFHLTNYIFHLLNVLLVYLFIKRFSGKVWVAFITSLFFGIHPMHVESVAWITERKDVLYSFFFLLSLYCYNKYLSTDNKFIYLFWSFFWFSLSLMSKPAAACLPLVLILMDYYFYKKIALKTLLLKIPFFAIVLLLGIVTVFFQKSFGAVANLTPAFTIFDRVFLFSYSTVYYLLMAVAPFNLCSIHFYPVKTGSMLPVEYYLALPALLLLIWMIFKSNRFKHEIIFGMLFYFITIIMVLQIIPVGQAIVSERYSYIPYIGVFFIIGHFFSDVIENKKSILKKFKPIISISLIFLIVLFCFQTYNRNKVWKNGIVLFTDVINKYPEQGFGWFARGYSKYEKEDHEGAIADFTKAIEINPKDPEFYFNRGNVFTTTNRIENAIADYTHAIQLKSDYSEAFSNRGAAYAYHNQLNESLKDFDKAISLNPKYAEAFFGRGLTKNSMNDKQGACNDWQAALKFGYTNATSTIDMYCK